MVVNYKNMQELLQKYHSLYTRTLSWYLNTCVTEQIYKQIKYLFQSYYKYVLVLKRISIMTQDANATAKFLQYTYSYNYWIILEEL